LVGNTTTGGRVVVVFGLVVGVGRGFDGGFVDGGLVGAGPGAGAVVGVGGGGGFVGAVVGAVVGGGGDVVGGGCWGTVGGGVGGVTVSVVVGSGLSVGSCWAPAVPVTPSAASAHSVNTMPRATVRNPITDTPRRPSGMPTRTGGSVPCAAGASTPRGRTDARLSHYREVVALSYEALAAADDAGLYYVSDLQPGITRRRRGRGWSYHRPDGSAIEDEAERARISAIAVPPAWTDVWISPIADGHIQATGRDAKGRKQYRYHQRWREVRDSTKYHRLSDFGTALPGIRRRLERDLTRRGLPLNKVLAAVVSLLDVTLVRIGNEEYAEQNDSFGLTTLQDGHAEVHGSKVAFDFRAKSGVDQDVDFTDRRLARIVQQCQDLPGEDLFQYLDDAGEVCDVTSTHVNEYLRAMTDATFTAKDFRTWGGTVVAAKALVELGPPASKAAAKRNFLAAVDAAADKLGNTRSVARASYVHPRINDAYLDGSLAEAWGRSRDRTRFDKCEVAVLTVLKSHAA
jgi:DNA topoisomerase-1